MSAEKVIYHLLRNNAPLTAQVAVDRITAGIIPLNESLPAIAYNHVSTVERTNINLSTQNNIGRVQITVASKSYAELKDIISLVKSACNNQRGTFNGVVTNSVILDITGPDFRDDEVEIYYQTIDFRVSYQ